MSRCKPIGVATALVLLSAAGATTTFPEVIEIEVLDASVMLSPSQEDYEAGYSAAEGAAGIDVRLRSNNATGLVLKVRCDDPSPAISLADLFFRTQTAPGIGGSSQGSYIAMRPVDQDLWSSGTAENSWLTVQTDIKVEQLWRYSDAAGGGVTMYANTLTFTVVAQ